MYIQRLSHVAVIFSLLIGFSSTAMAQTSSLVSGNIPQDQSRVTQDITQLNDDISAGNVHAIAQDRAFLTAQQQILANDQGSVSSLASVSQQFQNTQRNFNATHKSTYGQQRNNNNNNFAGVSPFANPQSSAMNGGGNRNNFASTGVTTVGGNRGSFSTANTSAKGNQSNFGGGLQRSRNSNSATPPTLATTSVGGTQNVNFRGAATGVGAGRQFTWGSRSSNRSFNSTQTTTGSTFAQNGMGNRGMGMRTTGMNQGMGMNRGIGMHGAGMNRRMAPPNMGMQGGGMHRHMHLTGMPSHPHH